MTALTADLVGIGLTSQQAKMLGETKSDALTSTGANQATALELVSSINSVTVVVAGADGVRLPAIVGTPWAAIVVRNDDLVGGTTLNVYPATGESINNLAANTAITQAVNTMRVYYKVSATKWISS